jgi:hypothetical protein
MNTLITKENIIQKLESDDLIVQSYVYSSKNSKYWKIEKSILFKSIISDLELEIPKGLYYDMSTVPKWLWSIVRPFNDGLFGYLVHDRLYLIRDHGLSRKQCDLEMLMWTNLTNCNKFDNYLRYFFVRAFGWLWWNKLV